MTKNRQKFSYSPTVQRDGLVPAA